MNLRVRVLPLLLSITLCVACAKQEPAVDSATTQQDKAAPEAAHAAPPTTALKNDPDVINFAGFGPAKFGSHEEAVRMAWGYPLVSSGSAEGSTCRYLAMDPPPDNSRGIWFMLEDDKFVRYDVETPMHAAPGDIVVGNSADDVRAAHAGRIEEQAHKYLEGGKVLIVTPPEGGGARLVFEIAADGKVINWRIGMPPQVYYVEGCG